MLCMWQESFLHTGISYKLSYHAIKYPFSPQNGEKTQTQLHS